MTEWRRTNHSPKPPGRSEQSVGSCHRRSRAEETRAEESSCRRGPKSHQAEWDRHRRSTSWQLPMTRTRERSNRPRLGCCGTLCVAYVRVPCHTLHSRAPHSITFMHGCDHPQSIAFVARQFLTFEFTFKIRTPGKMPA